MNDERFDKFLAAARRGRPSEEPPVRFGFVTRVAARGLSLARREDPLALWERLARWGAALTAVSCLAAAVVLHERSTPDPLAELAGAETEADALW
jgi:anti-sigma-K factor RskA